MIYAFNFRTLITRQLSRRKRRPVRIAWLYVLLYPIKMLHDEFVALVNSYKSDMRWHGQRIRLQRGLQLKFGDGILVENQEVAGYVLIGYVADDSRNAVAFIADNDNNPVALVAGTGDFEVVGFIVKVPAAIIFSENEMKAFINLYKQQSNYTIEII